MHNIKYALVSSDSKWAGLNTSSDKAVQIEIILTKEKHVFVSFSSDIYLIKYHTLMHLLSTSLIIRIYR